MRIGRIRLRSHNGLLKTYDGADGLKTGFTCDSGYNVVATATREGQRLVAWERHPEKLWHASPLLQPAANSNTMLSLLRDKLEPMLQRELEHRGLVQGSRGFETKLIGWMEVLP